MPLPWRNDPSTTAAPRPRTAARRARVARDAMLRVVVGLTAALAVLAAATGADPLVARLVHSQVTDGWHRLFERVSAFGEATGYVLVTLAALGVLHLRARRGAAGAERLRGYARYGYLLLGALALSGLIVVLVKPVVGRLRPKYLLREDLYGLQPLNFDFAMIGFPSGHSQTAWVVATVAVLLLARLRKDLLARPTSTARRLAAPLPALAGVVLAGATLVAASRVLVNAHFVSDALAGALLGALVTLWLAPRVLQEHRPDSSGLPAQPSASPRPAARRRPPPASLPDRVSGP